MATLDSAATGLLGIWAGAVLHYSFAATPVLFRKLGREEAGRIVALLFGGYYAFGWVAGGLALASLAALGAPMPRTAMAGAALATALVQGTAVRRWVIRLRDARASAPGPEADRRFGAAHGVSMVMNLVVLGLVLAAILS
jgi:hypothetical protein